MNLIIWITIFASTFGDISASQGQASCTQIPLGFKSGGIPSHGITTRHPFSLYEDNSRSWCSDSLDNHIELDLKFVHQICALKIDSSEVHRWALSYSNDSRNWSKYFQVLMGDYGEGQILPVYIMARYLRFKPHGNTTPFCVTNIAVNGSSQAYRADSCLYYWKELSATTDGLYVIYPNKGENRSLVLCLGLENQEVVHSIPVHDHDMKLQWPSTWNLSWYGFCSTCHVVRRYAIGGILLPGNATASLGDFRGTCVSDPEACVEGLSFELWLWFSEYDKQIPPSTKSIILQSGSRTSRGIELSVIHTTITFTVYTKSYVSECEIDAKSFENWIHLVGVWIKKSRSAQLFAGGVNYRCMEIRPRDTNVTDDLDGNLTLGPIAKIGAGFVVVHNLSVWMRVIRDDERQTILNQTALKVPPWTDWTNCSLDCKQMRFRDCNGCKVKIVKIKPCYDIPECGLRINWPLNNMSKSACLKCRNLVATSALILPTNSTVMLRNFDGTCLSDRERCINGLTFEIYLWFAEYKTQNQDEQRGTILKSGFSLGFHFTAINKTLYFRFINDNRVIKCNLGDGDFDRWVHIVGIWIKNSDSLNLHINNINHSCDNSMDDIPSSEFAIAGSESAGNLAMGPIKSRSDGYLIARNLSIWMRAIENTELDELFARKIPMIPGQWSNWTACMMPCKQMRYRRCHDCDLQINETRTCYKVHECGLRMTWPLNNASSLTDLKEGCHRCRDLSANSAIVLPKNSTASLGNFANQCVSRGENCVDGFTFEIWMWFAEFKGFNLTNTSIIFQSGASGFEFSAENDRLTFKYTSSSVLTISCEVRIFYDRWIHVVGNWDKQTNKLSLYHDKMDKACQTVNSTRRSPSSEGQLVLGPFSTVNKGYIVLQNLSIWMRTLSGKELENLFQPDVPAIPENWGQWSKCVQPNCTQQRRRQCQSHSCTVNIVEKRNCSVCRAPPNCTKTPGWNSIQLRETIQVYCENLSFSHDWLVILKRNNTRSNFTRNWVDYKLGFQNFDGNHWIGNEKLHQLMRYENFQLMVYFDQSKGTSKLNRTTCDSFNVSSEEESYAAEFKLCKGPAAHTLSYLNGARFSTYDRDNDLKRTENCAQKSGAGFWYTDCGKFEFTNSKEDKSVVSYLTESGNRIEMHAIIMMIRPYDKRYRELKVKLRFLEETWDDELADDLSHRSFLLAGKVKHNIGEIYRNDGTYITAAINSFRQGSVIASIILQFLTINGTQIPSLLLDLRNGYLNDEMAVTYNYSDFKILDESVPNERLKIADLYNTSSTSFNISWVKLTNMTGLQGYRIYFKTVDTERWSMSEIFPNQFQTTIENLKIFTKYFVIVLAYSDNSTSLPSEIREVTTDESVPEVGPNNISVYWNKANSTVLVTWAHIPRPLIRGYLKHYVITYSNSTGNFTRTSPTNSTVITGLAIFTQYQIAVAGATSIGVGPWSNISYRTKGIPLPAPTNLTATRTTGDGINVTWGAIRDDPRFDEVIGYRVYYYDQTEIRKITLSCSPGQQTNVTIDDVKANVNYDFTVCGISTGNREGRRADTSIVIWNVTAPEMPPKNLTCSGSSPFTISVRWYEYTAAQTGGSLKNYTILYHVKENVSEEKNITLRPYPPWYTLQDLLFFTEYEIKVFVYNEKGLSPSANITCKTTDGRPTTRPQLLQVNSFVGENTISLVWQQAQEKILGYKLLYWKVSEAGYKMKDETNVKVKKFSANKTSVYVHGLTSFSKYCFQILVFNEYFDGPSSNFKCAETCRCPHIIYTNWFVVDPYVTPSYSGIFPPLVKRMIDGACGFCQSHNNGTTMVHFKMDGNRKQAQKRTSKQVQLDKISNEAHISFPVTGPKSGSTGSPGCFMPIIDSPRSVFVTRRPVVYTVAELTIGNTLVGTLPLLAFTFVMLLLGAILVWAVEHPNNHNIIPKPFFQGVKHSLWWAFVSVTTVGYGDKVPKSILGRIFAMIFILYGIVLIGLVTTGLTTALTASIMVITKDVKLYGSQLAAIDYSLEFQLGLMKGARVNEKRNFSDVISVLEAVENGDVDGGLIDKLTAARFDKLTDPNSVLVIKDIIEKHSTYGVFVSGKATKMCKKFQQYLRNNANFVTAKVKEFSLPLKKGPVSSSNSHDNETISDSPSEQSIISASSPIFLPLLLWLLGVLFFVIMVGVAWHFLYFKHVFAAAKKNQVSPLTQPKDDISSLQQFVSEFRAEVRRKLQKVKARHVREWRTIYKLKNH